MLAMIWTIWPNSQPRREASNAELKEIRGGWLYALGGCSADNIGAALKATMLEDRAFAPSPGELVAKLQELADDSPEWGRAWREILNEVGRYGDKPRVLYLVINRETGETVQEFSGRSQADEFIEAQSHDLAILHVLDETESGNYRPAWSHPAITELVALVGQQALFDSIRHGDPTDRQVFEAQCRNKYDVIVRRNREDQRLLLLPAGTGLARIDRAHGADHNVLGESLKILGLPAVREAEPA